MVKLNKELTLGVLLIVIVVMVLKPNLLGFLYNNILGKLIFVAAIVFLSLKHTAAGLLAVVFVAIIASMSGYYGFEGLEMPETEGAEGVDGDKEEKKEGLDKNCKGDDCKTEGVETQNIDKPKDAAANDIMSEIASKIKK